MNTQKITETPGNLVEKPVEDDVLLKLPTWKICYSMFVLYFLYFFDYAARLVISPLFPYLKKDLGLTDPQLGMLTSVVLAGVCILSMPLAAFIDRWRRSKTLSIVSVIWSVASVGTGLSTTYNQIFASRAAVGIGEAGFSSGGAALISAMFSRTKRAMMIGIWNTSMTAGAALGLMAGGIIATKYGWQTAFYVVGIPGIVLGIMAWFMPDYENIPREKDAAALSFFGAFKGVLTIKSLVCMFFACGLGAVLLQTQLYWTSSLFVRFMGMTPAQAGTINGYMMLVGFISYPLSGWLADRWSERDIRGRVYFCALMQLLACITCVAGVMLLNIPLLALAMFFTFCIPSAQVAFTQEIVPLFNRATAYGGYVLTLYVLGGLWGPMLTGFVSAASNLQIGFLVAAGVSLISVLFYLAGSKHVIADFNAARAKEKAMGC
ncbi:MFS transporter [bacterium BFN5]|nr:MFS transporter [bacterium BFN5]QJW45273.1 MFS transporter [bacterium BFN5]